MKYLCMGYFDVAKMSGKSEAEMDAIMAECRPHMEELYKTDKVVLDAGLALERKFMRRTGGKVVITDGPYSESKELIGGVFLIEANDMEEAVRIAALHPTTQVPIGEAMGWRLEVRPIHYFKG